MEADYGKQCSVNGGAIALGHPLGATGVRQGETEDRLEARDFTDEPTCSCYWLGRVEASWRGYFVHIHGKLKAF